MRHSGRVSITTSLATPGRWSARSMLGGVRRAERLAHTVDTQATAKAREPACRERPETPARQLLSCDREARPVAGEVTRLERGDGQGEIAYPAQVDAALLAGPVEMGEQGCDLRHRRQRLLAARNRNGGDDAHGHERVDTGDGRGAGLESDGQVRPHRAAREDACRVRQGVQVALAPDVAGPANAVTVQDLGIEDLEVVA